MVKLSYMSVLVALCFSDNLNASSSFPEDNDDYDTPLNWRGNYFLRDGTKVIHTPEHVQVGSQKVGSLYSMHHDLHGMKLSATGLQLRKDHTRHQFERALQASGVFGGIGNPPKQSNPRKKKSMRNSDPGQIDSARSSSGETSSSSTSTTPPPSTSNTPPLGQKD